LVEILGIALILSNRLGFGGEFSVATGFLGLILSKDKAILTLNALVQWPLLD
jgi:hypothetical protein